MPTAKTKTDWDTRSWLLGLPLGNFSELILFGLLLLCGSYPPPRQFLETAFPYSIFGYYVGDLLRLLGFVCGGLVFPTVFTLISRHRYSVWVVILVVLLLLCVVTSSLGSHSTIELRDDFLPLLFAALLCWLIASLRGALFRLLWRRPLAVSGGPALATAKPQVKWVRIIALLVPFLALVLLGWHNSIHPIQTNVTLRTHWPASKEVTLPLVEYDSLLYVKAQLNGRNVLCAMDTGADAVEWPRGLHIEGERTQWSVQGSDLLGTSVETRTIVLPHMKFGGYEIENLPTEMSDNNAGLLSLRSGPAEDAPNLGNAAFVGTVLTIDRRNLLMTLRPPEYDFSRQQRKPGDRILEMGWATHYPQSSWRSHFYGTPSIQTVINGFTFWCTLDTGAGGPEICLTKKLVDRHLALDGVKQSLVSINGMYSSTQVPRLTNINISFPCTTPAHVKPISIKLNALITPSLKTDEADGGGLNPLDETFG